jgi:hypothetical protein
VHQPRHELFGVDHAPLTEAEDGEGLEAVTLAVEAVAGSALSEAMARSRPSMVFVKKPTPMRTSRPVKIGFMGGEVAELRG